MRILFSSLPVHGHTYPLIPLALAAREAGHEVVYATGEEMLPSLRTAGLTVEPVALDMREAFGRALAGLRVAVPRDIPEDQRDDATVEVFSSIAPRAFVDGLAPLIGRFRPDLVIHESGNPGAGLAAILAGVPNVVHSYGRGTPSTGDGLRGRIRQRLLELAAELGAAGATAHPGGLLSKGYLDIYPRSMQDETFLAEVDRTPLRPVSYGEPAELPATVVNRTDPRPLVYLTLGTAFGSPDVLRDAIAGLSQLDCEVLVAAGPTVDVHELGDWPGNVTVETWVPQARLLPHVDLAVHHGSAGTVLSVLAAGVPQLILPQGGDGFINAAAVAQAGAGDWLPPAECDAAAVTEKAGKLLADPACREAAGRVGREIAAMPTPAEVAARLERFTAS
ncbi:glycosyltransferase [Amycolatopsis suaedae]|uniref:Glycosyltransferase n=1 Tax=Amycolatopsis suaedae TaxID=2510978 RepID=A0A4Q7J2F4_9PSEU|nr:glycosyltransferase [Amycolatopsis suaedae]RZQ60928.1 glycosyltransferase [Amycolatopsis suaedae]